MHITVADLQPGAWLLVDNLYAQFVELSGDALSATIHYHNGDAPSPVLIHQLRPVYINRFIIERCGFRRSGNVYVDDYFEVAVGGEEHIYKIMGHRLQRPFITHLLSQLHIFQNIYRMETGQELVFQPL
jgi:hypothetical protein